MWLCGKSPLALHLRPDPRMIEGRRNKGENRVGAIAYC